LKSEQTSSEILLCAEDDDCERNSKIGPTEMTNPASELGFSFRSEYGSGDFQGACPLDLPNQARLVGIVGDTALERADRLTFCHARLGLIREEKQQQEHPHVFNPASQEAENLSADHRGKSAQSANPHPTQH
jgi:hypothetical protein